MSFNGRTYRFECGEGDAARFEELANYVKGKIDALSAEHGAIGDERLVLMTALTIADELFDARASIDGLLEGAAERLKAVVSDAAAAGVEHDVEPVSGAG